MGRFAIRRVRFNEPPRDPEDDDGRDLPRPALIRLQARRVAGIREAAEALTQLPEPGESLHCLMTARLDMSDVLNALLEKLGRCDEMTIATLGYNRRNMLAMLRWLDSKTVGKLTLLASIFFRSHKGELWKETQAEFRKRNQRAACCHSHSKVATLAFATGERFAIEGSANLCSNGSAREQFALVHDAELHDWHSRWIVELVGKHESAQANN
jgi:hypothetical protein